MAGQIDARRPDARRHGPRCVRRRAAAGVLAALAALLLAGCAAAFRPAQAQLEGCTQPRLITASLLYEEAKEQLAQFYRLRDDSQLFNAYFASGDSLRMARSTRRCFDFDDLARSDAVDLIRSNRLLRILVRSNMRDPNPGVVAGIYRDQYREVLKNEIY